MEYLIALLIGILFSCGVYMILGKRLLKIVFGVSLLSNASLLFLITMGKLQRGEAPIIRDGVEHFADPLPQAMILTAIVINFAITAFALVLAFQAYRTHDADDIDKLSDEGDDDNE